MTGFRRTEGKRSRPMRVICLGTVNELYDSERKAKQGDEMKGMSGSGRRGG